MEWKCPTDVLMDVLLSIAEAEWGKGGICIREEDDWNYPPVVVRRYKYQDEKRDQLIMNAVESFRGKVEWTISFRDRRETLGGRNWSISLKRLQEFSDNIENIQNFFDSTGALSLKGAFAALHPEIGLAANKELPQLAEHIKKIIQEGLNSKVLT